MKFFIYRNGTPSAFQLVSLHPGSAQGARVRPVKHTEIHASLERTAWHARISALGSGEKVFLVNFKNTRNSGHDNQVYSSSFVLSTIVGGTHHVYPVIQITGEYLPSRRGVDNYEVPLDSIEIQHRIRILEWLPVNRSRGGSSGIHVSTIRSGASVTVTSTTSVTSGATAAETLSCASDIFPYLGLMTGTTIPLPTTPTLTTRVVPLSAFVAKQVAENQIRLGGECPIEMEALATFDKVLVPTCGHVCGPSAKGQTKCPVCRETVAWTEVKAV